MARFWFVTWTTYGSWLPGDPRGFRTRRGKEYVPPPNRYAAPGEEVYDPREYADRYAEAKRMVPQAVRLSDEEKGLAVPAIVKELDQLGVASLILAGGNQHFHLIAAFGTLSIRPTVGRLKSAATRAIPNPETRKRIWTKECDMHSLNDIEALRNGVQYIRRHVDERAIIHAWPDNLRDAGV